MPIPGPLRGLVWELPHTFLGLDEDASRFEGARAVILPVPYESTTSYGAGTSLGPRAIIEASRYIELYDQELDAEPYEVGISTLPALSLSRAGAAEALRELRESYEAILAQAPDSMIVMLGGEHSISSAPILAWADRMGPDERLSVLQIDAHTDLRPEYEGSPYSHASVMSRVRDRVDIVAVGIRALTREERESVRAAENVHVFFAEALQGDDGWIDDVLRRLTGSVYITFDVDGLDPSLVPSTGTPEPGGLGWYQTLRLLRRVFAERRVVAVDVVELAPLPGLGAPDFLVAKLVYKMIGYRFSGDG